MMDLFETVEKFLKNIDYEKIKKIGGNFLEYIKKQSVVCGKETTRVMLELYFVMSSEKTSKFDKFLIGAALAYQLLPKDFWTKEDYGVLGAVDNVAFLYFAYKRVKKSVTPEITQQVDKTLDYWAHFTIMKPEDKRV